jgi:hypothetical protein
MRAGAGTRTGRSMRASVGRGAEPGGWQATQADRIPQCTELKPPLQAGL